MQINRCPRCKGTAVEVSRGNSRRLFVVRCLNRRCRQVIVHDLGLAAATAGILPPPAIKGLTSHRYAIPDRRSIREAREFSEDW